MTINLIEITEAQLAELLAEARVSALKAHCVSLEYRALAEFDANHQPQAEAYRTAAGWAADAAEALGRGPAQGSGDL